jgi:molybdopterin/thiamine biosynthesis adenylyltransferase
MAKADAMAQILSSINPSIRVIIHKVVLNRKNIPQLFQKANVIVECLDQAEAKDMFI